MKTKYTKQFWVTNVSNKNVSLRDLAISLKSRKSYNLLDKRYHNYTEEVLSASAESGSIYKKNKFIKVRIYAPQPLVKPGLYVSKAGRPAVPLRSTVEVEEKRYDEFASLDARDDENQMMSEEKFAEENADMDAYDEVPTLFPGQKKED